LPFNDQFATEVAHRLETQERRDFWWVLARDLAYPALGVGILFFFLRLFRRTSSEELHAGALGGRLPMHLGNGHSNGNGNGNGHHPGLGLRPEPANAIVTVEVLNQLIKENPQNMTQAIRAWLDRDETPPSR
jgi:hypothetical protein